MTTERHELHELVDELPEDQVAAALADVRRRLTRDDDRAWAPEFFGIVDGADSRPTWPRIPSTIFKAAAPARPRPPRSRLRSGGSMAPKPLLCHSSPASTPTSWTTSAARRSSFQRDGWTFSSLLSGTPTLRVFVCLDL
jgi:hypothetical protein